MYSLPNLWFATGVARVGTRSLTGGDSRSLSPEPEQNPQIDGLHIYLRLPIIWNNRLTESAGRRLWRGRRNVQTWLPSTSSMSLMTDGSGSIRSAFPSK